MTKLAAMDENYLSIGFAQTTTDYFGEENSQIKPISQSISYARQMTENWQIQLSYEKAKGDGKWLNRIGESFDLVSRAETETSSASISVNWQNDDYSLSASYSDVSSDDRSVTLLPIIVATLSNETVLSDSQVFSFGFDQLISMGNEESSDWDPDWNFDWGMGIQYATFDVDAIDLVNSDPPTFVETFIEQDYLSGYLDLGVSYWIQQPSYAWSPYLSVSWNWKIDESGDQLILVSRGDSDRVIDRPGGRLASTIKIPNSGSWDAGISLLWLSGWSVDFSYSQTLSTTYEQDSLAIDISVNF